MGFAAAILAMVLLFAGCGQTETKTESSGTKSTGSESTVSESTQTESSTAASETEDETLVHVLALKGPTSMGMVKMMSDNDSKESPADTFELAAAPDEVSAKLVQGEVDIAAVPANLASVLYNKTNGGVQVLAVNTLGVLYIVEDGDTVHSIADLKGRTIYAGGKGATPEYALNYILEKNGLVPGEDVTIEWKSEHAECVAALAEDADGIAMLPQPFVTTAQTKKETLRTALDLTEEWNKIQESEGTASTLVTGVTVVRTAFAKEHPEAVADFMEAYQASVSYVTENTDEAAKLIGDYDIVPEAVAKKALPACNIVCITGDEMKEKLSGYLGVLKDQNPEAVGGELPGDDFYYFSKKQKRETEKNEALADRVLAYDLAGGKRFCRAGDPSGISCCCFETPFYACNRTGLLAVPAVFRSTHRSRIPSWCGGGNCRSCTCRSVFHCRRTPDAAGCSSESSAGRFFCDSDPDLGFFEESFGCDFVSDGISDPVYKHAERPTGTGHSAFGDDRRFSGSAAGAAALGDPAAAVPIYPDGMFTFPRPLLEGRNGSRSNRHSEPIHRRASVSGKNISRHTGTLCLDGSDRVRQLLSRKSCFKRNGSCRKKDAGDEMREDTIEICHLKKAYGEHVIFSNLTMELKKGAVTCLMAPSGAGKTTLLRILAGLEQADGGKIGGLEALRKSMVFQEPRLAEELTAAANIQLAVRRRMFGKEKRSSRHLVEEMEELGLSGCENQAVSELSGGMRQRVAVLRAMRMDADFLLLDEPFRGLDAGTKKKTMNYIRRKGKEKTMLLVTHDLEEAEAMGDWICTCSRLDGILEIKRNRKSSTEI